MNIETKPLIVQIGEDESKCIITFKKVNLKLQYQIEELLKENSLYKIAEFLGTQVLKIENLTLNGQTVNVDESGINKDQMLEMPTEFIKVLFNSFVDAYTQRLSVTKIDDEKKS